MYLLLVFFFLKKNKKCFALGETFFVHEMIS